MYGRNLERGRWWALSCVGGVAALATIALLRHVYTQPDAIPPGEDLHVAATNLQPSSDGSVIVFKQPDGWKVLDAKTRAVTPVPFTSALAVAPLPSGRFVAAFSAGRRTEIDVVDPGGNKTVIATSPGRVRRLVASPNAPEIAVLSDYDVARVPLAPTTPVDVGKARTTPLKREER